MLSLADMNITSNVTLTEDADWRNPQEGKFSQGALRGRDDNAMLDFTAERSVEVSETNVVISARMEFLPLTEPPLAPSDALAAVTAVWECGATNYWGLVKVGNGAGVWRPIPGLQAKVDVPVDVEIEFAYGVDGTCVQYRLDGEASEWLETTVESVGGVGVRGTLHSLTGRRENLGRVQNGAPMMNAECGNVWGYKGSTGDCDFTWDYHAMINAFRSHLKCGGFHAHFRASHSTVRASPSELLAFMYIVYHITYNKTRKK